MQKLPHTYHAQAKGSLTGTVETTSKDLPTLQIAAPVEFDGPGDKWSPEELLIACVANCLILTFRAIAQASKLEWSELTCEAKGILEMEERTMKFTEIFINASLKINSLQDEEKASQLLEKAEKNCLITNSLTAQSHLKTTISTDS